jgi:hypothetical protein
MYNCKLLHVRARTVPPLMSCSAMMCTDGPKKEWPFNNKKGYSSYFFSAGIQPTNDKSIAGLCLLCSGRGGGGGLKSGKYFPSN